MRKRKIIASLAVIVALVGIAIAISALRQPSREVKLSDGSVIRVESVTYGRRQPFKQGGWFQRLKESVAPHLPKSWTKGWIKVPPNNPGNWWMNATAHTNSDALQIWITRRSSENGPYRNVGVQFADVIDSHGCVLAATLAGGENAGLIPQAAGYTGGAYTGQSSGANWLTFEAFPRDEPRLKMRLYDWEHAFVGEITIANPAPPASPAKWQPASIPVRQTVGDQTYVLKSLAFHTNKINRRSSTGASISLSRPEVIPKFEVLEKGGPAKDWQAVDIELWDSSGNFASKLQPEAIWLCPQQTAWKLIAKFCGSEHAASASNTVSVLRGVKIPRPGEFTNMQGRPNPVIVAGYRFNLQVVAGIGDFVYSNNVPVSGTRPALSSLLDVANQMAWSSSGQSFHGTKPHIVVNIPALNDDQWLSIRAVDDQGRESYGQVSNMAQSPESTDGAIAMHLFNPHYGGSQEFFYSFDLPADAKTMDLYFCIHTPRSVEFIFKPPQPNSK
jgi:hypothetical protein